MHNGRRVYYLYKRSSYGNQIYCVNSIDSYLTAVRYGVQGVLNSAIDNVSRLANKLLTNPKLEGTDADVYITIFDNISGKAVFMAPAVMSSTHYYASNPKYWEYVLVFHTESDGDECYEYFSKSRYHVYITPAWALSATIDSSNVNIDTINTVKYPFSTFFNEGDSCKITYGDRNKNYFGQFTTNVVAQNDPSTIIISPDFLNLTEDASIWISPQDMEHVSYVTNGTKFDTSTFILTIENTSKNKQLIKHIDKSFAVQKRKFDINNAINCWMSDASIAEIETLKCPNEPFETTSGNIVLKLNPGFTEGEIKMIKWSVYKNTNESKSKLYFECLNNVMFLHLEPGIYDISVSAYDKHGNKYKKRLDKWITVK